MGETISDGGKKNNSQINQMNWEQLKEHRSIYIFMNC